ncbi:MAG: flagellar basal-body rod protein FlgF [Alphaproteobacteria bacterium]|nr:flagellar basal-body rod protein FlgF [Alphaproteobacteria bacterium]MCK5519359.1 flagellar basal-body rod protein FlgF [Alphaproteobacteria bacterium]MCK5658473.1 flagellar basal-body rod protein FlgF [Alphaproteobacteria bacterium]
MENISYIGLSQQIALRNLMDVTANNMANMNTPGFKSQNVLFKEYLNKAQTSGETISQVQDYGTYRDIGQGTLTQTSNNLDLAIQGDGFFAVKDVNDIRYTRAGAFSLNNNREIVTRDGLRVMSDSNSSLVIPADAAQITIARDGSISTENGSVGKLKVVMFNAPQMLTPIGGGLYDANNAQEMPADNVSVEQGMLENSNVQPLLEMNKMIELMRMYQSVQDMLVKDHERMRGAIQRLTKA